MSDYVQVMRDKYTQLQALYGTYPRRQRELMEDQRRWLAMTSPKERRERMLLAREMEKKEEELRNIEERRQEVKFWRQSRDALHKLLGNQRDGFYQAYEAFDGMLRDIPLLTMPVIMIDRPRLSDEEKQHIADVCDTLWRVSLGGEAPQERLTIPAEETYESSVSVSPDKQAAYPPSKRTSSLVKDKGKKKKEGGSANYNGSAKSRYIQTQKQTVISVTNGNAEKTAMAENLAQLKQIVYGRPPQRLVINPNTCPHCRCPYICCPEEGYKVCPECTRTVTDVSFSVSNMPFGEERAMHGYEYDAKTYFHKKRDVLQAYPSSELSQEYVQKLLYHIKKQGIDYRNITREQLRIVMEEISERGANNQYNNLYSIHCLLTGIRPIHFAPVQNEVTELYFTNMQPHIKAAMQEIDPKRHSGLSMKFTQAEMFRDLRWDALSRIVAGPRSKDQISNMRAVWNAARRNCPDLPFIKSASTPDVAATAAAMWSEAEKTAAADDDETNSP